MAAIGTAFVAATALAGEGGVAAGELRRMATGFQFTEGPIWHADGYFVFSDIPADRIYALKKGEPEVYREPSGHSNGLAFDWQGRLVACEHGNRRVSRTEPDGTVATLADSYQGRRLNSPNDLAIKSDGSIYFTDPPYGVRPEDRELDFQGVYRIGPDGELTLLVDDFIKPNGIAFSPDEKVLYVDDTEKGWVRAFDVGEDGMLENGRVFARLEGPGRGRPDGMKVDVEGNVYVTGPGGVWVFDPAGKRFDMIETPEVAANLAFGGAEGRTLFITASRSVYQVPVMYPGAVVTRRSGQRRPGEQDAD
jgi:gluconolactonase